MKNDCIMQGYFKEDKLTNETIKNGYLHTGDKGVIDNDGYLIIHGSIHGLGRHCIVNHSGLSSHCTKTTY